MGPPAAETRWSDMDPLGTNGATLRAVEVTVQRPLVGSVVEDAFEAYEVEHLPD